MIWKFYFNILLLNTKQNEKLTVWTESSRENKMKQGPKTSTVLQAANEMTELPGCGHVLFVKGREGWWFQGQVRF